jgi:hypothetical protein
MEEKKAELTRREFLKGTALVAGVAAISSSTLLTSCSSPTQIGGTFACPYCATNTTFSTKEALKDHIYNTHAFNNVDGHVRTPVPFCITIGSIQERKESPGVSYMSADDNIQRHIDELIKRGWPTNCSLEMPTDLTKLSDAKLKYLGGIGCEMALDVGQLGTMDSNGVSYADQLAYVREQKNALEQATGKQVRSARRSGSSRNQYTYQICQELGIKWYHISPAYSYMQFQATGPYKNPDYDIVMCPRPSLHLYNDAGDTNPLQTAVDAGNYF